MARAAIYVRGAFAELQCATASEVLAACLAVPHPFPHRIAAYREKRWDGLVRFYSGTRFPAGLAERVIEHLQETGREVAVHGLRPKVAHDWSWVGADYLPPVGKFKRMWPHQLEAVQAALAARRGVIKAPTGSGKTEMIAALARALFEQFRWRTLILAPKKGLMHQTVERLQSYYGDELRVGWMGDSERVEGDVVVATGQTMQGFQPRRMKQRVGRRWVKRMVPPDPLLRSIVRDFEVIIGDEVHRASSTTWYDIFMASRAKRRYGFSATPLKSDDMSDTRMIGATGPIIYECQPSTLIEAGLAAKPKIAMVMSERVSGEDVSKAAYEAAREATVERLLKRRPSANVRRVRPDSKEVYRHAYRLGIVENDRHNRAVLDAVQWLVERGRRPLVFCRYKPHWERLRELLEDAGINFDAVWGDSDKGDRDLAKQSYGRGSTRVVLTSTIWDEGEDIPNVDAIVLAEGVRSVTNALQRIGRGMRRDSKDVWVVDFVPTCHPMLLSHAASRADHYESEGYEVLLVEEWRKARDGKNLLPFETWDRALARA